jgi:hypothetical protein
MPLNTRIASTKSSTTKSLWTGRVVSWLCALYVAFAAIVKLLQPPMVLEGFVHYGYPARLVIPIGVIELTCAIVYLIPRTSVLGAILLTGLIGGATATNLRIGDQGFVAPVILGILVWGGLFLRDQGLRDLIPIRRSDDQLAR